MFSTLFAANEQANWARIVVSAYGADRVTTMASSWILGWATAQASPKTTVTGARTTALNLNALSFTTIVCFDTNWGSELL